MLSANQGKINLNPEIRSLLLSKNFKEKFLWACKYFFQASPKKESLAEDWYGWFISIIKWWNISYEEVESISALLRWWIIVNLLEEVWNWDELDILTTTFIPHLYKSRVQGILSRWETSNIQLYWKIWKYDVYKIDDQWDIGYVVSSNWKIVDSFHFFTEATDIIYHLNNEDTFNILISNWQSHTEIWHWDFQNGFEIKHTVKWTKYSDIDIFVAENTIIKEEGWIIELINIATWNCIFRELNSKVTRGNIIEVTDWPNQTVVVSTLNEETKEEVFFVTDENNIGEYMCWFSQKPTMIQYNGWCITISYFESKNEYLLVDIWNQKQFRNIQCFKDSSGKIYYDWELFIWDAGNGHIYLLFSIMNEDGSEEKVFYHTNPFFEKDLTPVDTLVKPYPINESLH